MKQLSREAVELFNGLTPRQRRLIRKTYPFRRLRNQVIRRVKQRGVPAYIIGEVSGLSRSQIQRIATQKRRCGR